MSATRAPPGRRPQHMSKREATSKQAKAPDAPRKLIQRSFRIFEDQLERLYWVANVKYRGMRKVSNLVREALEQGLERWETD